MISAWRSAPRVRFLLCVPVLALWLIMQLFFSGPIIGPFVYNHNVVLALVFYGIPILTTIAINRAIRKAEVPGERLRFARIPAYLVMLGMLLMLSGTLLWGFALALFAPGWFVLLISLLTFPWNSWLLIFLGMLLAVMVALWALFSRSGSPDQAEARPKDASLSDVDWFPEPRGDRG